MVNRIRRRFSKMLFSLANKISSEFRDAEKQNIERQVKERIHQIEKERAEQDKPPAEVIRWFQDKGDRTLRLEYDLKPESVVFDLGGYEGQWTSDIFSKYCCSIYVFEPVKIFYNQIAKRFDKNLKIVACEFGLSNKNQTTSISIEGDASSIFKQGDNAENINLVDIADFFIQNNIDCVDLMKINIEGGEYELLDYIIESGLIMKIKNIQVQFHNFVPEAETKMNHIQSKLSQTHNLQYQYYFVWEGWKIKD